MIAKKRRFGRSIINCAKIGVIVFVLIVLCSLFLFFDFKKSYSNHIFPHVYVGNVDVSGQSKEMVKRMLDNKNQALKAYSITASYKNDRVATFSAETIKASYDSMAIADKAYTIGRSTDWFTTLQQQISSFFHLANYPVDTHITYDSAPFKEYITNLETAFNRDAKNALFKFDQGKVVSFRPEEKGLAIEENAFFSNIDHVVSLWESHPQSTLIIVTDHVIIPQITLSHANNFGIEEEIGIGQSNYSHSIPERIHNIILAASKIDGVLIPQGKDFSFNDTVGDISSVTGYQPAYIIKGGKTVLGDGGGVCQVSTTLFRAALNSGLPIIQRFAHAYRVGYYENDSQPGFDATVFAPYADFRFKNDTPASILIQTEIDKDNNILRFRFFGKKDGRQVTISKVTITDVQPAPPSLYQDDPTLKKGVVKQTDFAASGAKANFTYNVTLNGKTLINTNFFSSYQPWQAVYLRGTAD